MLSNLQIIVMRFLYANEIYITLINRKKKHKDEILQPQCELKDPLTCFQDTSL